MFKVVHDFALLSSDDEVIIIASLKYMYEKEFQCKFTSKFKGLKDPSRGYKFHAIKFGCGKFFEKMPTPYHQHENLVFKTCVCTLYDNTVNALITLENNYNKFNSLPEHSDLLSAPAKLIRAFTLIRNYLNLKELEQLSKQKADLNRR